MSAGDGRWREDGGKMMTRGGREREGQPQLAEGTWVVGGHSGIYRTGSRDADLKGDEGVVSIR